MPWLLEETLFDNITSGTGELETDCGVDKATLRTLVEEATAGEVLDALYDRREELVAAAPLELRDFVWVVRGGLWTSAHVGVPYDSCRGSARPGLATLFYEQILVVEDGYLCDSPALRHFGTGVLHRVVHSQAVLLRPLGHSRSQRGLRVQRGGCGCLCRATFVC